MRFIKKTTTKAVALYGIMTSLAIAFGYIEHLIPLPVGAYGIKLGLANIVILVMLYSASWYGAFSVNAVRIILCAVLFGSFTSFWYSLVGGILSFFTMLIIKRTNRFSPLGVSICGAVSHNIGQTAVAVILMDEFRIAIYLPVLLIVGAITGAIIGLVSIPILKTPVLKKLSTETPRKKG